MSSDKREAILAATRQLLACRGFHGFSVKQVADRAEVATGTIYLYFKDREDLITQLQQRLVEQVARALFEGHDPLQSLHAQYVRFSINLWRFSCREIETVLCKNQFDHLPFDVVQRQQASLRAVMKPLIDFIEQGREQGILKPLPDEVLFALGFDHYALLARRQHQGLIQVEPDLEQQMISAGWDAIAAQAARGA